jgi:hypothetical protein
VGCHCHHHCHCHQHQTCLGDIQQTKQDLEGKKENGYSVLDSKKKKINDTKELNDVHKNILKEEILQVITENFIEMLLEKFHRGVTRHGQPKHTGGTQEILRQQK